MAGQLFDKCGGYRKMHSFTFATMTHLETISFCRRFVPWQEDTLGKTAGQMIGAARSGRQNIIEGSERASTSKETEIKLLDVARASLAELLGDYEIFLAERREVPWSIHNENYKRCMSLQLPEYKNNNDQLHEYWKYYHENKKPFEQWFGSDDPVIVANAMLIIIQRTMAMLSAQLKRLGKDFLEKGGFREKMYQSRREVREKQSGSDENAPRCPECGKEMKSRTSRQGEFWGCSAYPQCKGTREV